MKALTAKEIIRNIDWTVKIRTKWQGENISEDLVLPDYKREAVVRQIQDYIDNGKECEEKLYTCQIGGDLVDLEKLINFIAYFKKKYGNLMRKNIDKYNEFPIQVKAERQDQDDTSQNIVLRCRIEYDRPTLIKLATDMAKQESYKYEQEYLTMIRVSKTLQTK